MALTREEIQTLVAFEQQIQWRWTSGDPTCYMDALAEDVTYFDPFTEYLVVGREAVRGLHHVQAGRQRRGEGVPDVEHVAHIPEGGRPVAAEARALVPARRMGPLQPRAQHQEVAPHGALRSSTLRR
ncbi:hypothetical protein [Streptomyces rishiriensis]|uniref:hypothetical protein n=1 Tax=Streptomyces rishiriensis TaxID=68264 RepID=UPI0037D7A689